VPDKARGAARDTVIVSSEQGACMSDSVAAWEQSAPAINWSRLGHVYVVGNGKGGVGKTTTSAHLGALVASDGARTLIVDLNGQGNIAQLLGFAHTDEDDQGRNLFSAVTAGAALDPVRNVRPNLDVVPGGQYVRRISSVLAAEMSNQEDAKRVLLSLADCLQAIAGNYHLIIIDTPPENPLLLQIALCAARFVVVPMKSDNMSRTGLRDVAKEIRGMREHNPYLMLLAVFVFASGTGAKNIRKELSEGVSKDLGQSSDLVLKSFVRHSEAVARDVIKFGRLAHELEHEIQNNPKHWELRRGTATTATVVSSTSRPVAEDFAKLASEILTRAAKQRAEMIEKGEWP
jgi:chromosome partitioning protein